MQVKKSLKDELIAEFFGTYLFLLIGIGCVAALTIGGASFGQWEVSIVWGIAVSLGVYVAGAVSGAHLNPSVTIAAALFQDFPKGRIIPFIVVQFLAGFAAALTVYGLYHSLFPAKDLATAGIFTTFPHKGLTFWQAFLVEFGITTLLVFGIFTFSDKHNKLGLTISGPILVGLLVAVIGSAFGPLTGFAMNAARDFAPRLCVYFLGWGSEVMTANMSIPYYVVPLIAPILGGVFGGFLYQIFMRPVLAKLK